MWLPIVLGSLLSPYFWRVLRPYSSSSSFQLPIEVLNTSTVDSNGNGEFEYLWEFLTSLSSLLKIR